MEWMMNEQGEFELYDDTYDVVIHCDSEKARDEVLADLKAVNERLDVIDKIRAEIEEKRRGYPPSADEYKTINKVLQILDKYKAESEGEK